MANLSVVGQSILKKLNRLLRIKDLIRRNVVDGKVR
jgi:hypothetical protein